MTGDVHPGVHQEIPLAPPGRGVYVFIAVLLIAYLAFLIYLYSNQTQGTTPELQQEHFRGMVVTAVISILTALPIIWAIGRRRLIVTDRELQLRAGFYRVTVPLGHLRIDTATQLSLFEQADFAPRWRTNGIRLPGYRVGWFRLRNGHKGLMYLTDPFCVTVVPTAMGYFMVLSTDALLPVLRARTAAATNAATAAIQADAVTAAEPARSAVSQAGTSPAEAPATSKPADGAQ